MGINDRIGYEGVCPICGEDLIYGKGHAGSTGLVYYYDVTCAYCNFEGKEIYDLVYRETDDYNTGYEYIRENCHSRGYEEATNCGSIGSFKRSSIDLIPNVEDGTSRFDIDDEDDGELLVELEADEPDDDEVDGVEDGAEDNDIDVDISEIVDTDDSESVDSQDSTDPIEKQKNKRNADNSISI